MLAPMDPVYRTSLNNTLAAVRVVCSKHPQAASFGPEEIAAVLYGLRGSPRPPEVFEIEAALEALRIEGEILS